MNCSRFETLLTDYMDGTLDHRVQEAAQQHLSHCEACSLLLTEVADLREQLESFPVVTPPSALVENVLLATTGLPQPRSVWRDLILPTLRPFMTQRYAYATIMLFVSLSLMVNLLGPPVAAMFSPSGLAQQADRFTSQVTRSWAEAVDFQARVVSEVSLLAEDLRGRVNYHFFSLLFKSYRESVEEQSSVDGGEQPEQVDPGPEADRESPENE